jgi:hypothetical protein
MWSWESLAPAVAERKFAVGREVAEKKKRLYPIVRFRLRGAVVVRAWLAVLLLLLSGCAYISPMVESVRTPRGDDGGKTMPLLAAAIADADGRIAQMEGKRDSTVRTARLLDLLTFGLAGGAAYAAITTHHVQSVRNLGFGAAATYAGANLFAPMDIANVYQTGVVALACVANRGAALRTAVARYRAQVVADDAKQGPSGLAQNCIPDSKDLADALAAQDKAKRVLDYAVGADAEEASRVRQAANGVVAAVNREVLKRSNNPDVIFAAARGLVAHPTGAVIQPASVQVKTDRALLPSCGPEVNQRIRDFTANYGEIDKAVTATLNAMAALDTSCVLEPTTTEALTLSQEEVTVTKDATVNVLISGGRQPYAVTATGTATKDVSVQLVAPRTIVVTGLSTIKAASTTPFTFQVKDNSVITVPKTLKVSTKLAQ